MEAKVQFRVVRLRRRPVPRYTRFKMNRYVLPPSNECIDVTPPEMKEAIVDELTAAFIQHIEDTRND